MEGDQSKIYEVEGDRRVIDGLKVGKRGVRETDREIVQGKQNKKTSVTYPER